MVKYNETKDKIVDARDSYLGFVSRNPKTMAIAFGLLLVLAVFALLS